MEPLFPLSSKEISEVYKICFYIYSFSIFSFLSLYNLCITNLAIAVWELMFFPIPVCSIGPQNILPFKAIK